MVLILTISIQFGVHFTHPTLAQTGFEYNVGFETARYLGRFETTRSKTTLWGMPHLTFLLNGGSLDILTKAVIGVRGLLARRSRGDRLPSRF